MQNGLKKFFFALTGLLFLCSAISLYAQKEYTYESVPGDPLKTRIYTLDNGLKVFMTVYKDAPRIQTIIAVRAGSKYDPHDATGLAHYFEHMMFKGTGKYGTTDFKKEAPLIAKVDSLFEVYRVTDEDAKRQALYHLIDSFSVEASKYAIPNEYDKLVSLIGAKNTNAFTSWDQIVFLNDIPSNQIQNWAAIEAERFSNPVLRLFHTELEAVYEEKNMSMTSDPRKVHEALLAGLFQKHTYGTQTTLGTIEHLKNPSMKRIREFYETYFVPNNMAVIMSGDFNPDEAIKLIDTKFGSLEKREVPAFTYEKESKITSPIVKEVVGPDAESISLAYRFDGAGSKDADIITMIDMILSNSSAGLIDLNLNQKQKVLSAGSHPLILADYSAVMLTGKPKEGQSLDDVKDLLLSQIELVKKGEFPDWLLQAIINDLKLDEIKAFEENSGRGMALADAFVLGVSWEDQINMFNRLSKITKDEIVAFANERFKDNYVVVYKRTGKDNDVVKIKKPKITPVKINREDQSPFLLSIQENDVPDIEPVFIDFDKDIQKLSLGSGIPVLYNMNKDNETFNLYYIYEMGTNHNRELGIAIKYLDFLGTSKYTPEQVKQEFYKLGASYYVSVSSDQVYVGLKGLSENMEPALKLFEELLADAQPNKEALDNLVQDILKKRKDAKLNFQAIFGALVAYGMYGPESPFTNKIPEKELEKLDPNALVEIIHKLNSYQHKILYYGSHKPGQVVSILDNLHQTPAELLPLPAETKFVELPTTKNKTLHVDFDSRQAQILMLSQGPTYAKEKAPIIRMFNEYFGGSMNSVVFQELRESRALAYTAMSLYQQPEKKDKHYYGITYIATQNDKIPDAISAIFGLFNEMPESEKTFELAKKGIMQQMRTERITKTSVLLYYLSAQKLGLDHDIRKDIFEKVPGFTFNDIKSFEAQYVKEKPQTMLVLGDVKSIDFKAFKKYGKVKHLKLEDVFGY